jgi:hypothetical protein
VLSLAYYLDLSPSGTPGSSSAASIQFLRRRRWPSTICEGIGTPNLPTLRFPWGVRFRGFTTVRFRYDLSSCSPSCRSRPDFRPAYEDFYSRASDGLVARSVAGYDYGVNWIISTGGSFTR